MRTKEFGPVYHLAQSIIIIWTLCSNTIPKSLEYYVTLNGINCCITLIYLYLLQFGNTCYINSVLQALYFCKPFREKILEYKAKNKRTKETLLACLADLFYNIATQKKKVGTIAPKKFIARFRKENGKKSFNALIHD